MLQAKTILFLSRRRASEVTPLQLSVNASRWSAFLLALNPQAKRFVTQQESKSFMILKTICRETANIVMSIFDAYCMNLS